MRRTNGQNLSNSILHYNVLPTNYTVSQYNPMTSPLCTFCQREPEKCSHLFFDYPKVTLFYEGVKNIHDHLALPINFIKRFCIFGSNCSNGSSKENIILSLCRGFIWKQKAWTLNNGFKVDMPTAQCQHIYTVLEVGFQCCLFKN